MSRGYITPGSYIGLFLLLEKAALMKALVLFALLVPIVSCLDGPCNSYDREKLNEGYKPCVYKDSKGIPTVGVGFNLEKFGARGEIESVGANYGKVMNGSECLTDSQIKELFDKDMNTAVSCVSSWLSNWSAIGSSRQSAVADMSFNLGCGQIKEFTSMKAAIEKEDYGAAATDMRNSLWCRQVGGRCDRDVDCMK
jgi:GH24 family phage-related lysozyme (muramidase)